MASSQLAVFALKGSLEYGQRLASRLSLTLEPVEERAFEDGEHKARPLTDVRDRHAVVVHSLFSNGGQSVNDKLCRMLFFIGALKQAGARRVTAIAPYLCYARKDRQTNSGDPVTTRYVACLFEAAGADHVVTIDVHNLAAFQNAFRCQTSHVETLPLFVEHFSRRLLGKSVAVVSPDIGGTKRAEALRRGVAAKLPSEPSLVFMEKYRRGGVVSGEALVGEVRGRAVVIIDDMISSGATLARAAQACRNAGASEVHAAATHALFIGGATKFLATAGLDNLVIADTIPQPASLGSTVQVLDSSGLLAEAIRER